MRNIRSKGTRPELKVARELKRRRIYFSSHSKTVPGKPDIIFRRKKIAVFIDSDFWHGNPGYFKMPKSNTRYWKAKIEGNRCRDRQVNAVLRKSGWKIIRIWEHNLNNNLSRSVLRIINALQKRED